MRFVPGRSGLGHRASEYRSEKSRIKSVIFDNCDVILVRHRYFCAYYVITALGSYV